ncbi:acetyl/propionyl/methylcrotonyl-CoA carboxylase subunit alpha [Microbacterium sp. 179-I 3D4 NHS]|uniref:acetyl/propionyl/methylcrotonyl-CoA carboxylase subunit alpha n=1 Tax=Microbacterium sp. 179-I 3D4 NHS TaxID=3142381 RepID=UPI0039A35F27
MTTQLFATVLVANRGEIARRIIRTLRALGIRSVAVYSDADAGAPHVREADDAIRIGGAPAAESYLDVAAVVAAAVASGAQAVHPGYGFLSESVRLAEACAENGIVFVGPGREALDIMGDKARARAHVESHGVPVVPGFDASGLDEAGIAAAASEVGFPLLVKPSAGGGGKGMEVVEDPAHLAGALSSARRVAAAAFGDDALVLERLIRRPRHIEVQVFGDAEGTVIALGERECTLQRRHQKVIEEAPSAGLPSNTRERLLSAAVRAAESVAYVGAGTVEFLVDADAPEEIFFIEMNTRLQVEHPVTEAVTGLDLVELQLRVAAGLPVAATPPTRGHAVEARVYAESPERGFLPSTGTILLFEAPAGVRVDAAVETGSEVTAFYDPMIAKVIAHADSRREALDKLETALGRMVVLGVETNIAFLRRLCRDERVRAGDLDTSLIQSLLPIGSEPPSEAMLAAARAAVPGEALPDRAGGVWAAVPGWRLGGGIAPHSRQRFLTDDGDVVETHEPGRRALPALRDADGAIWVSEQGRGVRLRPLTRGQVARRRIAERARVGDPHERGGLAPMPGAVVAVHVADGDVVQAGAPLVSIEAMKMEHAVVAPHDGVVHLLVGVGDQVRRDQPVARVETEEER